MGNLNGKFSNVTTSKKLSQRVLSLILALTLVLSMTAIGFSASAAEADSTKEATFGVGNVSLKDDGSLTSDWVTSLSFVKVTTKTNVIGTETSRELETITKVTDTDAFNIYAKITVKDGYEVATAGDLTATFKAYDSDGEGTGSTESLSFTTTTNVDILGDEYGDEDDETVYYKLSKMPSEFTKWTVTDAESWKLLVNAVLTKSEDTAKKFSVQWASAPETFDGTNYTEDKYFTTSSTNFNASSKFTVGDTIKVTESDLYWNNSRSRLAYNYSISKVVAVGLTSGTEYPLTFVAKDNAWELEEMPSEKLALRYTVSKTANTAYGSYREVKLNGEYGEDHYTATFTPDTSDSSKLSIAFLAKDGYYFDDELLYNKGTLTASNIKLLALSVEDEKVVTDTDWDKDYLTKKISESSIIKTERAGDDYITGFTVNVTFKNDSSKEAFRATDGNYYILQGIEQYEYTWAEGRDYGRWPKFVLPYDGYTVTSDPNLIGGKFTDVVGSVIPGDSFDVTLVLESGYTYTTNTIKIYSDGECIYNAGDNGTSGAREFEDDCFVVSRGADLNGNPTWSIKTSCDYCDDDETLILTADIVKAGSSTDGWNNVNGKWQYIKNGVALTGWQSNIPGWEGQWFYFNLETGYASSAWECNIPGWLGKFFYFDTNTCVMKKGWVNDGGNDWYFLGADGVMVTGWQWLNWSQGTNWFYFVPTGQMACNTTTPDGYTLDANGVWK